MSEMSLDAWQKWDARSQEKLADRLASAIGEGPPRLWFCDRGRTCDGRPHGKFDYRHARGSQWPPPGADWFVWFLLGGRGAGKTATGSQYTRKVTEKAKRSIILGPTITHVRDVMVEGESGILAAFDAAKVRAQWEPSKRRITNLVNGNVIFAFTGEEPERLRGPESSYIWLDEPAHMPLIETVWDNAMFGLRLGARPHVLCTTTPLPTPWVKKILADEGTASVVIPTYENLDNLAPTFRKVVLDRYEGTRLGRQELMGEILQDVEGALWDAELLDTTRTDVDHREMDYICVGVDPSGTESKKRDETGIVAVGRKGNELFVLEDVSGHYSPSGWAKAAWALHDKLEADSVVAEKNYGGEMVRATLAQARVELTGHLTDTVELVNSRRGKELRADPLVGLFEQRRAHMNGYLPELEGQCTSWVPGVGSSPDRVDAMVHAATKAAEGAGGKVTMHIARGRFDTATSTKSRYPATVWSR